MLGESQLALVFQALQWGRRRVHQTHGSIPRASGFGNLFLRGGEVGQPTAEGLAGKSGVVSFWRLSDSGLEAPVEFMLQLCGDSLPHSEFLMFI